MFDVTSGDEIHRSRSGGVFSLCARACCSACWRPGTSERPAECEAKAVVTAWGGDVAVPAGGLGGLGGRVMRWAEAADAASLAVTSLGQPSHIWSAS
ncbi:unnamed protein product [Lampetra fluviatilis]